MATTFYLSATATPPVSPAFLTYDRSSDGDYRLMSPTKDLSALASKTFWGNTSPTASQTCLIRQYVSDPMASGIAFAIGDTVKCYVRVMESSSNDNINQQRFSVRVFSQDGTTLRKTLLVQGHYGPNTTEWNSSLREKIFADGDAFTDFYTTVAGDRLVIELGGQVSAAGGTGVTGTASFGNDAAADLADADETDIGADNPWFYISRTVTFATTITKTQTTKAATKVTQTKTQTAKGATRVTFTKTQTVKARTNVIQTKTQTALTRVNVIFTKTMTALADMKVTLSKTMTSKASMLVTSTKSQTALARMLLIYSKTLTALASIKATLTKTQIAKADIKVTLTKTQTALARMKVTYTKTQTALGRMVVTFAKEQTAKARMLVTIAKTQTAKAYMLTGDTVTKTMIALASIKATLTKTMEAKASILATLTKSATAKGAVLISVTKTMTSLGRIVVRFSKTQSVQAWVKVQIEKTQIALASIQATLTAKARMKIVANKTVAARACMYVPFRPMTRLTANRLISSRLPPVRLEGAGP